MELFFSAMSQSYLLLHLVLSFWLLKSESKLRGNCFFSLHLFDSVFVFELYVEKKQLLGNLDIAEAIAAFLQLCFVCDLSYPKVKQFSFYIFFLLCMSYI